MSSDDRTRVETGIEFVDRELGGGIPEGTVTVVSADPASQSELFLTELVDARETRYLTALRPASAVESALAARGVDTGGVSVTRLDDDDPFDHARSVVADLPAGASLVVDPVDALETAGDDYRRFLGDLAAAVEGSTNVVVLHCLRDEHTPARRRETVHVADLVFEVTTEVRGDSVVNRLSIPKFRTGRSMEDVVKLDLTSTVEVDMTRNIL